ncbi:Mediator of RNA polymerase II transcription subunit 6 [Gamsiella multidivaricata]|nr:Mediator of RNA polymerase II transcription subunit 6 [Gamsiella multidivaricata]
MATGNPQAGASGSSGNADTNLLNMEWRFHEWIMGVGGLNPDNVLDYFALSPFWDPECNNAVLRMQTQFNNLGEMKQRLSEMTGIEFALVHERYPTLFIIQKQRRRSPQEVKPMAIYYVLQGSIYQCPDLQTLLSNRILGSLYHVESAFNEARVMTEFHPSTGYHWKSTIVDGPSAIPGASTPSMATAAAAGASAAKAGTTLSQDFMIAVDRAIKDVDQRAQMQQFMLQSGNAANGGASSSTAIVGADSKVKQEGETSAAAAASTASRNAPKAANKRRKKSEEASAAAANMGINTNAGAGGSSQGRPPSAGGANQAAGPATPSAIPAKRRKKTKTIDPK